MHLLRRPEAAGLYDPQFEHDACGIGAVADLKNTPTHETVAKALWVLDHLEHRGASGAEMDTGDGAGILLQTPDEFMREAVDFELPERGRYAVGAIFLPREEDRRREVEAIVEQAIEEEGQAVEARCGEELAIPSFSSCTLVYKGMLTSPQLPRYYPDLSDERMSTAIALVHSRFSTNTFPSWELAHPYRMICHNGEINTLRGNVNWMRARESQLLSEHFGDDLAKLLPVAHEKGSDSAIFDNVLEILVLGGRSLPHALTMMIPEAWENHTEMAPEVRDFYAYHSCLMEPWTAPRRSRRATAT